MCDFLGVGGLTFKIKLETNYFFEICLWGLVFIIILAGAEIV